MWADIGINVLSDFIFVVLVLCCLGFLDFVLLRGRLGKATRFFGIDSRIQIQIYVPSFRHPNMSSHATLTVVEYVAAVDMRRHLENLAGTGFIYQMRRFLAQQAGMELRVPPADIRPSPMDEVQEAPDGDTLILIGGPVTNQLTRFYLRGSPQYRWDFRDSQYQERVDGEYKNIEPSGDVAVVEKRIIDGQVVFLAHGFGEKDTARAVQYLIDNWEQLYRSHGEGEFGIRV